MLEVLQILLLATAAWGLFAWLRAITAPLGSTDRRLVELGLLLRVGGGLVAFVVSYLRLPLLRSLQFDRGLWFYAMDSRVYESLAYDLGSKGLSGFLSPAVPWLPSPVYVRTLVLANLLFGSVIATGIFLNAFFWLGIASLIVRWPGATRDHRSLALVLIGFSPLAILWSTQPLKDPMFLFLIVGLAWGMQQLERSSRQGLNRILPSVIAIALSVGLASGIRWYFSVFLVGAITLQAILITIDARRDRLRIAGGLALVVMVAMLSAEVGARSVLAMNLTSILSGSHNGDVKGGDVVAAFDASRRAFEATPAATQIRPGYVLRGGEPAPRLPMTAKRPGAGRELDRRRVPPTLGLAAGAISIVVPHAIAQPLGLVDIGGGRGLWAFADLDTLWFDLILVSALVAAWEGRGRRSFRDPTVLSLFALAAVTAGALLYVVTNFGTLMRHRGIFGMVLILVPLAVDALRTETPASGNSERPV